MYNELDYRYHARGLQTSGIDNLLNSSAGLELQQAREQFNSYINDLTEMGDIVVDSELPPNQLERFQDLHLNRTLLQSKRLYLFTILKAFTKATEDETRRTIIVELDEATPRSNYGPIAFPKTNFNHHLTEKEREQAHQDGKDSAINEILIKIQKPRSTRLLRYRYPEFQALAHLYPATNRGAIGYLPTSVEGVDLRYYFFSPDAYPLLSLLVQKLEDEQMSAQKSL